jgi:hypothetical protein
VRETRTSAKGARYFWKASRALQRSDRACYGHHARATWWLRLEGVAFFALEYPLVKLRQLGEEIVMVATSRT